MDENYLEAHFNLAFSYDAIGNYKKSLLHYSKVIEINPEYIWRYLSTRINVISLDPNFCGDETLIS